MVTTERLSLRLPELRDAAPIVDYYRVNREFLQPWSPTFSADLEDAETWLQQVAIRRREFELGESFRAFIFDSAGSLAGNINLTQVHRGASQSAVLGYSLAETAQGSGYMTEAVRGMVRFAFDDWNLHRVTANYIPRNERSGRVLERCGFVIEGRAGAYLLINGRWEDHVLTAITNPGWQAPATVVPR